MILKTLRRWMMTLKAITSGQQKQLSRFLEDAVKKVNLSDLDDETAQRVIENGDKLPEAIMLALRRLGRKQDDIRVIQAQKLWNLGFGTAFDDFESYLATIPAIPAGLIEHDPELPLLTLDDPRVPRTVRARLAGIQHAELGYADDTLEPFDARHETGTAPYWFRAHDGRKNHREKPFACRKACTGKLLAGTADVGIALFTQHEGVVQESEHVMDLPGSVHRGIRAGCAFLGVWGGQPRLYGGWYVGANPECGSVVFRRE